MARPVPNLALTCDEGTLTVTMITSGWFRAELQFGDRARALGAEQFEFIAGRLRSFLVDPTPGLRCVMTLFEDHGTIYGEHHGDGVILHFQDPEAVMFAHFLLSATQVREWIRILDAKLTR